MADSGPAARAEIVPAGSEPPRTPGPASDQLGELVSASLRYPETLPPALAARPSAGSKILAVIAGCTVGAFSRKWGRWLGL